MEPSSLPLDGLRVVDLADGVAALTGRLLADLGADVVRVEPPSGAPARRRAPLVAGVGVQHLVHNANKRSAVLDLDGPDFARLVARAAILVHDRRPGQEGALADERLLELNPRLVVVVVRDFGRTGPYLDWAASDEVLRAPNASSARSDPPGVPTALPS